MKKIFVLSVCFLACLPWDAFCGDDVRLTAAYMCEQVSKAGPENRAVVFSASEGRIFCFSYFERVPAKSAAFHVWYHRDRFVTKRKFVLEPPSWKIYSTMQLRETDTGPWRVEILGADNKLLDIVRFSVTD